MVGMTGYLAHGDCYNALITSTDFFAKVLSATKTRKSHGRKFHEFKDDQSGKKTRFDHFKMNMKRLGQKFDLKRCKCSLNYTTKFYSFISDFDAENPTGKISNKRKFIVQEKKQLPLLLDSSLP